MLYGSLPLIHHVPCRRPILSISSTPYRLRTYCLLSHFFPLSRPCPVPSQPCIPPPAAPPDCSSRSRIRIPLPQCLRIIPSPNVNTPTLHQTLHVILILTTTSTTTTTATTTLSAPNPRSPLSTYMVTPVPALDYRPSPSSFDPTLTLSLAPSPSSCLSPPHHFLPAFPTSTAPTTSPIMPRPTNPAPHPLLLSSPFSPHPSTSHPLPLDFPTSICPPPVPKRRRTTAPLLPQPSLHTPTLSTTRPRRKSRSRASSGWKPSQKASLNGLKTFTMSVVAKLKQYATSSSYTAVADELVCDAFSRLRTDGKHFSEPEVDKNIRRRVYDALNVLASMGFVARSGKDVEWKGIAGFMRHVGLRIPHVADTSLHGACNCPAPPNAGSTRRSSQLLSGAGVVEGTSVVHTCTLSPVERHRLENEKVRKRIAEKRARVSELRSQESCLQQIVTRNASRDSARVTTGFDVLVSDDLEYVRPDPNRVDLPFVMISTDPGTSVAVEMEDHKEEIVFRFDGPFKIHEGYSIVGQVCQQEERDRKKAFSQRNEGNTVLKREPWRKLYDGPDTSSVTDAAVPRYDAAKLVEAPRISSVIKRRTPPCFALHRPDFLR